MMKATDTNSTQKANQKQQAKESAGKSTVAKISALKATQPKIKK